MPYVIADDNGSYIRKDMMSNKYVPVRNITLAAIWDDEFKARNVLSSSISKKNKKKYHVQLVYGVGDCGKKTTANNVECKQVTPITSGSDEIEKWKEKIAELLDFTYDAEERRVVLTDKLSNVDKEITDIYHYIEFTNLNAAKGFRAYKILQERLKRRRKIKNELSVLTSLKDRSITSEQIELIKENADNVENRTYTPRVLKELFE